MKEPDTSAAQVPPAKRNDDQRRNVINTKKRKRMLKNGGHLTIMVLFSFLAMTEGSQVNKRRLKRCESLKLVVMVGHGFFRVTDEWGS